MAGASLKSLGSKRDIAVAMDFDQEISKALESAGGGVVMPPVVEHGPAGVGCQSQHDVVACSAQPASPSVVTDSERVVEGLQDHILVNQRKAETLGQTPCQGALSATR